MKSAAFICALGLLLCNCTGREDSQEQLDKIVGSYHAEGAYNGTILIADSTGVLLKKAYGMADFAASVPLKLSHNFYMASVSKQFTAVAIMILNERQQLSLEDKLSMYFPGFPSWANEVSIRHMLTHTSGIPDYYELGLAHPGFTNTQVTEVATDIDSLHFAPGEKYEYSNTAYVLLSTIVQQVSGLGFHAFMQSNVFEPLGMLNTVAYDDTKPDRGVLCKGFTLDGLETEYPYFTTGGGGLYSNVEDMYKWHLALQAHQLVSEASMQEAYGPMTLNDGSSSWYGFGWMLDQENPQIVHHTGSLISFRTYIERNLDNGQVIIMLNNVAENKREALLKELKHTLNPGEDS